MASPNMNLPIPVVGVTSGPQYATDIDACLTIIDSHNHSAGSGTQITPAGLNISSDLSMLSNNLTLARSVRMSPQVSPLALAADVGCVYVSGVDLYYNDSNGNQVRITQSGGIAGSPGSISNLTSPASAAYVSANQTFVWQSNTNTPANMDFASAILRNLSASSHSLTLQPPAAMGADYTITLPPLPASTKIMTMDSSGNISAPYTVDNSTITISSNVIGVPASGIGATQLAANSVTTVKILDANVTTAKIADANVTTVKILDANVTTAKLADQAVTPAKLYPPSYNVSASSGAFTTSSAGLTNVTNLSASVITVGALPVTLRLESAIATVAADSFCQIASGIGRIYFLRNGTIISSMYLGGPNTPPSAYTATDFSPGTGTPNYTVQVAVLSGGTISVSNVHLVAKEG